MKKLQTYSKKSELMNIRIQIGSEVFRFNIHEELKVDENIINDEISEQPTIRAFLSTMGVKLDRIKADKEAELEKTYAELFIKFKSEVNKDLGKFPSDDMAKHLVIKSKKYQDALLEYNQAKENFGRIKSCVESFDQRGYLIQTLSANIRTDK